jgi:hypothetical protein
MLKSGEIVSTEIGDLTIVRIIGKGKSGYSYLAERGKEFVVYKLMHYEHCPYYHFRDNKVKLEEQAYKILSGLDICIPEMLVCNHNENYLIKKYIEGLLVPEYFEKYPGDEIILLQLFNMANKLKMHNLNIDYFPSNFVISKNKLYYIDYEVNPYSFEWSLENWGIYYWANFKGMAEYNKTGEWKFINISADSGIPIKEGFEEKARYWNSKYSK